MAHTSVPATLPGRREGPDRGREASYEQTRDQPTRNPPPPLVTPGDRQVAASNSTLNAWVGRRQPSWLANAMPVQPTPRPSRPQPPSAPSAETAANGAPSLPQSWQPRLLSSLADPVLPSPAPSDEPSPCVPVSRDSPRASPHGSARGSPAIRSPYPAAADNDSFATVAPAVLANHMAPNSLSSHESRDVVSPVNNAQPSPVQGVMQAQPDPIASSTADTTIDLPPIMTPVGVSNIDAYNTGASNTDSVDIGAPPNIGPPRLGASHVVTTSRPIAPKRRRVENTATIFLDNLNASGKIRSYVQQIGGENCLDEDVERPRFILLMTACRKGDLFFVALHQLFCSWTTDQASVQAFFLGNRHTASQIDNAFGILGQALKPNFKVRDSRLKWLADFPLPLATMRLYEHYNKPIYQVLEFLMRMSENWKTISSGYLSRGYPLLMREFVHVFRLYSPTLQTVLFRASRRTLGVHDGPVGDKMEDTFRFDQDRHRNSNDGTYSLRHEGETYDRYNTFLIARYQSLFSPSQVASRPHFIQSPSMLPTPSSLLSPGTSPGTPPAFMNSGYSGIQANMAPQSRTVPSQINTGGVVGSPQDIQSPLFAFSPSISPLNPNFSPQYTAATAILPSSSTAGVGASPGQHPYQTPYQNHGNASQRHPGTFSTNAQPGFQQQQQQQYYDDLVQRALHNQQQQQPAPQQQHHDWHIDQLVDHQVLQLQQNQQQHQQHQQRNWQHRSQCIPRKRSQPGAVPNSRQSPIQVGPSLAGQMPPAERATSNPQNYNNHSVSTAPHRNFATFSEHQMYVPQQFATVNSLAVPSNVQPHPVPRTQQNQQAQVSDRFIPLPGFRISTQDYPLTPYEKRSVENSLHQAHLRSPRRIPRRSSTTERFYQAVKGFALAPTPIPRHTCAYDFPFELADPIVERLTLDGRVTGEVHPVNRFSNGSLRIRVRCCSRPSSPDPIPDHVWATTETTWPDHIFMSCNGQVLEIKRKQHHSKDLPVEISSFVHAGINSFSLSIFSTQTKKLIPIIAMEIVEVLSHSAILQMVQTSYNEPADETLEIVRRRLARSKLDDDLEIPDGIPIDLADPFTATIYKIPVRGKACTHLECFDLETWLNTRLGKNARCVCGGPNCKCPKEPSFVDKWRCPLCNGDARPYSLRIDKFLVGVRTWLENNNQLRTKSITVFADGTWKANDSSENGDGELDSDEDNSTPTVAKAVPKSSAVPEVIELDDD